jgi:hypothetical protein
VVNNTYPLWRKRVRAQVHGQRRKQRLRIPNRRAALYSLIWLFSDPKLAHLELPGSGGAVPAGLIEGLKDDPTLSFFNEGFDIGNERDVYEVLIYSY